MSSSSLGAIIRRGALWSIATTATLKLTSILTTAVIARILDPRDFGVYAVALTTYGIVTAIGEFGLGSCLIRADLDIDVLAPTMATVALTTNAIQAGVMVAFARPIAAALGSAAAAGSIRVLALAMLITGVFAVPGAQLIRDFKQDKIFLANLIGFFPSTAVLILLAISGSGAMAFAWSMVVGTATSGCVMLASVPRHYRPGFSRGALGVLVKFGFPLAGANIVNYILLNGDYAVVGHLAGAVALGAYVLAFNVASWPYSLLGFMVNNVSMPAFSRVKDDADRLKRAITRALRAISLVVMPMSAFTIALARPLVLTLYGYKWTSSVQPLAILACYGGISIICVLFANILVGLGRAKFVLMVQLVWLVTLIPEIVLGVHRDGIVGAAIAHVIVIGPIVLPLYLYGLRKITELRTLARAFAPAVLAASAGALVAAVISSRFTHPQVQLITGLIAGGLAYAVIAAPYAITLLSQEQIEKLGANRILRLYAIAPRLVGLPDGSRPEQGNASPGGYALEKRVAMWPGDRSGVGSRPVGREFQPSASAAAEQRHRSGQPYSVDVDVAKEKMPNSTVDVGADSVLRTGDETMPLGVVWQTGVLAHTDYVLRPDDTMPIGYRQADLAAARTWWTRAAEAGDTDAQYNLGRLLATRLDPPDLPAARTWWTRAAETGHTDAQYNLGVLLADLLDPPDLPAARTWWTRAAEAGDTDAQYNLGRLLATRLDPPDLPAARTWWTRAAEAGDTDAQYNLGRLLATRLDPPDLPAARTWWTRAAETGHTDAQYNLGVLLADLLDPPDLPAARTWWTRAAEAGDTDAQYNLGRLLATRLDPPDLPAARTWWTRAAETGHTDAQYNLGVLLADLLDPPDLPAARTWWTRAAETGHTDAQYNLGRPLATRLDPPDLA